MTLRRPKDMRDYFKGIQGRTDGGARFEFDFDQFYFCLMVGLDEARLSLETDLEPAEFTKGFPASYKPYAPVIAGLLVDAEMRRKGVPRSKETLQAEFRELIDVSAGGTQLTDDGTRLLSRYAARGFERIRDEIPNPTTLEDFLVAYHNRWDLDEATQTNADKTTQP